MWGPGSEGRWSKEPRPRKDSNFKCIKYLVLVFALLFFLIAGAIIGGSIYILVDKTFISVIMYNDLMMVSVCMVIAGCALVMLSVPFCGCLGASKEHRCLLMTYLVILGLLFLTFLTAGVLCFVLRGQIGEWVIQEMENSLKDEYGVDQENAHNRLITYAWDKAQEEMYCCAVREHSWPIYRNSHWYAEQPGIIDATKPYVPESCCKQNQYGIIMNKKKCQTYMQGPPYRQGGEPGTLTYNSALNYRGCYEAGRDWIWLHSGWLIGFGIGFGCLMIFSIVFTVMLLIRLRR